MVYLLSDQPMGAVSPAFCHDGNVLVSAGVDLHVSLWDVQAGKLLLVTTPEVMVSQEVARLFLFVGDYDLFRQ